MSLCLSVHSVSFTLFTSSGPLPPGGNPIAINEYQIKSDDTLFINTASECHFVHQYI